MTDKQTHRQTQWQLYDRPNPEGQVGENQLQPKIKPHGWPQPP